MLTFRRRALLPQSVQFAYLVQLSAQALGGCSRIHNHGDRSFAPRCTPSVRSHRFATGFPGLLRGSRYQRAPVQRGLRLCGGLVRVWLWYRTLRATPIHGIALTRRLLSRGRHQPQNGLACSSAPRAVLTARPDSPHRGRPSNRRTNRILRSFRVELCLRPPLRRGYPGSLARSSPYASPGRDTMLDRPIHGCGPALTYRGEDLELGPSSSTVSRGRLSPNRCTSAPIGIFLACPISR
jgi:hypothetical protein